MLEKETFLNFDDDTESAADEIHIATQKEVARDVTNSFIKEEDFGKDPSSLTQEFDKWWRNLIGRAKVATRMEQGSAQSSEFSAMDDSIITAVNDVIVGDDKNKAAIIAKIQGEDIKLNQEQEIALKNIYKIHTRC